MEETTHSDETSHLEERADIKTRWKKGQSGNPAGNPEGRLPAAGYTLTGLARLMMEQPVQSSDAGERKTRFAEYMLDIVRRADAGDLKCRMFLLKAIDRGDRRKIAAQRNAKKARTDELRKFEQAKADEISPEPSSVAVETELVNIVSPTALPRTTNVSPPKKSLPQKDSLLASAATLRRDPHTGHLLSPEGRELSREEEERLLYPNWPHISPHLKKEDRAIASAGPNAGESAGRKSPASDCQAIDFKRDSGGENFSQENPPSGMGRKDTLH
jgi:Family of unknown function (DUF5681)